MADYEIEYFYFAEDRMREIIEDIKNGVKEQPWTYIPFPRVKRIWGDYARLGFVRDDKGMDKIADIAYESIAKVYANTVLCGHDTWLPEEMLEDYELDRDSWYDLMGDSYYFDHKEENGWVQLRISDYAMKALSQCAVSLLSDQTAERKLRLVDGIFNIIHQRSDIASWFVKGGSDKLMELSEMAV